MSYKIFRCDSADRDFAELVAMLDKELAIRDGDDHAFFAQFNKIDLIKHVVVLFDAEKHVACGAIKPFDAITMEVKRMFVVPEKRGNGLGSIVVKELEKWSTELGYCRCILETGQKQPEAISLYKKNNYAVIPNYGQYADVASSVCFEKLLL